MRENESLYKSVDGEKLKKYFEEHTEITKASICRKAYVHLNFIYDAYTQGRARIAYMNSICEALGVPREYFDAKEPPKPEPKSEAEECSVDLADIQLSLNKIEALLIEQNKLLRGSLLKGESK